MSRSANGTAERVSWTRVRQNLIRFYEFVRPYRRYGAMAVGFMLLASLLQLPTPLVTRYIIDKVLTGTSALSIETIGMLLVALMLVTMGINVVSAMLSGIFRERVIARVEVSLFRHIVELPLPFHLNKQPGYLLSRIGSDSASLQGFLAETAFTAISSTFLFLAGTAAIFWLNPKLAAGVILFIPPYVFAIKRFGRRLRAASEEQQETIGRVWGDMSEALDAVFTVKAFSAEEQVSTKTRNVLNDQVRINLRFLKLNIMFGSTTGGISALVNAFVLTFGGRLVLQGEMSLGTLVAFMSYVGYVLGPVRSLSDLTSRLQVSVVCLERIFSIFDQQTEFALNGGNGVAAVALGDIRYENVSFAYPNGTQALRDVSLAIPTGRRVAFVGRSGSGKTTAAMMLMKMFTGHTGTISWGGQSLQDIPLGALRRSVGVVPQQIAMFTGSIVDNVRLGREEISDDEVTRACEMANIDRFVNAQGDGLKAEIGRDGTRLSGGEKQRLAIARALVRRPPLLLFDEATSDLDSESEELITKAIHQVDWECSMVIIAHRLATVRNVDAIYVFDEGRVIASGSHAELLESCDLYRDLCLKQFVVEQEVAA